MPSIFNGLKRRSKSFRSDKGPAQKNSDLNGIKATDLSRNKSSSTLNSPYGSNTPPSTVPSEGSASNTNLRVPSMTGLNSIKEVNGVNGVNGIPPVPPRPQINANRYSMMSAGSPTSYYTPLSQYAPRVTSINSRQNVNHKVLLIYGRIGDGSVKIPPGEVTVTHHQDNVAPTSWDVDQGFFKALVYLLPGPNKVRLDFRSPKLSQSSSSTPSHASYLDLTHVPASSSPPLELAIILAKDSPEVFDATPSEIQREGQTLDVAIRKYRMAAYLWQSYTSEQMWRAGFGRRTFRLDEQWQTGTLSEQDFQQKTLRNEAKVHVIRCDKTLEELRDLEIAQQNEKATKKGDLFGIASEAVKKYFDVQPGQNRYVATMFLDSHWDPEAKVIRGHAAVGGGDGSTQVAVFGSHALHTYPSFLEWVQPVFKDATRTDLAFVANDCNESGSNWEAANIGIGAHLHEVGHLFGCPHQESGIMMRDYVRFNRTFVSKESFSTRNGQKGSLCVEPQDECAWHVLDCLRFRFHPCFRTELDPRLATDNGVQVWTMENGSVLFYAKTGIAWIELFLEGDDVCRNYINFCNVDPRDGGALPRELAKSESDLRSKLPDGSRKKRLRVEVFSAGGGKHVVEDFSVQANPKLARVKLPIGGYGLRGGKLGFSQMDGSESQEMILANTIDTKIRMSAVRIYHGLAVDGIEFLYEDGQSQMFGKRGGKEGGTLFPLDIHQAEVINGFYLRAGLWIDGIELLTSKGRRSGIFGNPTGGSGHTLLPPSKYKIVGISGSCGQWLDGFQVIIARQ